MHIMQTRMLPGKVIQKLDQITRNFVWGINPTKQKLHLVNWDTLCEPKDHGGVGLHLASDLNKAMILKLT